jgi:hypothetical protein
VASAASVGYRAPPHGGGASGGVLSSASDDDGGGSKARCASGSSMASGQFRIDRYGYSFLADNVTHGQKSQVRRTEGNSV